MSAYEWFRIRRTMLAYDYWLDVEGVTGRARKDLRAELVGNLTDATAAVGYPAARRSLGSVRTLATAAAPAGTAGPAGSSGRMPRSSSSRSEPLPHSA